MFNYIKSLKHLLITVFIGIMVFISYNLNHVIAYANSRSDDVIQIKKNLDMVSFVIVIGIVGGCIASTLIYVSWIKYKSEEKRHSKNDSNS